MSTKACSKCGKALAESDFYPHASSKDGLQPRCKVCEREANLAYQRTPRGRAKHRLYSRRYYGTARGKAVRLRSQRRYREEHPERIAAMRLLNRAVGRGEVERQPCEVCGDGNGLGHHSDYARPLDVTWLCPGCHAPADAKRRARECAVA